MKFIFKLVLLVKVLWDKFMFLIMCYRINRILFFAFPFISAYYIDSVFRKLVIVALSIYGFFLQELTYCKLNDYVQVNRFTGKISMTNSPKFYTLKKDHGKGSLDFLARQFSEGILSIPNKRSLNRFKMFETGTHEPMFNKIRSLYPIPITTFKIKKNCRIRIKIVTMGNPFKLFNDRFYNYLTKKTNLYTITL
jgi:hypothetical protein